MTTLTLHIEDTDQETVIRTFLDALHVNYDEGDTMDTTEYLNSTQANREHLDRSTAQALSGEVKEINWEKLLPR
jgi:hypothetical protein